MRTRISRLFRLEPGEGFLVFVLGFILMSNALAMQISNIVGVSGILSTGGVNQILVVLFIDYALILLAGGLQTLIVDKFERVNLMGWIVLAFAFLFLVLRIMFLFNSPDWLNYSLMYIIAEQQFVLLPLVFWVLASDIFKISQAKRLFPLISGWNFVGKLIGIGVAAISPALFANLGVNVEEVLTINILLYLVSYILIISGLQNLDVRKTTQKMETVRETLNEGWAFVREVASFRYMMIAILLLALADTIIEFRFLVVTDSVYQDQASYQQFYSIYRLGVTLAALAVQTFVTSRIIKNMQLKNTFLIFPVVVSAGAVGMMLVPGLSVAISAMVLVKLVRDTIHESGRKSFQGLVPEERRGRVSTMMETYLPAFGTMLACLVAGGIVYVGLQQGRDVSFAYLAVAGGAGIFALWSIFKMREFYDSSLFNWRLKRRQRRAHTVLLDKIADS